MPAPPPQPADTGTLPADAATLREVRQELDAQAARVFALFAALAVAAAAPVMFLYDGVNTGVRSLMQALLLALAVVLLGLYRLAARGRAGLAVNVALVSGCVVNAMLASAMGVGVQGQSLGLFALLVALAGVLRGLRAAVALAALCLALVVALYQAEALGWIGGRSVSAAMPSINRAYTLGLTVVMGLVAAVAMSRLYLRAFEEAALQRERLRAMLRISTDWIWEQDAAGRFTHVSEGFARHSGIAAAGLIGHTLWDLPALALAEPDLQALREAYARGAPLQNMMVRLRADDGRTLLIALSAEPVVDAQGRCTGWRGVGHDVTRLLQESQRREVSERLLTRVFQTSPDAMAVTTLDDSRVVMINQQLATLVGLTPEQAVGRDMTSLGIWADPADRDQLRTRLLAEGQVRDLPLRFRASDGRALSMLMSASRLAIDGVDHIVSVARNVSELERERAETALLLQHAAVGLALTRNKVFERVNPMYERLVGYEPGTLAGQSTGVVFANEESRQRFRDLAVRSMSRDGIDVEVRAHRKDGSDFPARLRGRSVNPRDPRGSGMIWVLEDITERRRAQRQLAAAKEQAEAASQAKSAFLATMSHEIRTPLNGVLGMLRLALEEPAHSAQREVFLRHAQASGQSLASIITDILDLSRVESGRLQLEQTVFDLHALAEGVHAVHESQAQSKGLGFGLVIAPGVPRTVHGDPVRVRQVIVNLVGNAIKFTEDGRVDLMLQPLPAPVEAGAPAREGVRITVRDTGIGVPAEVQQRLFQPFVQADSSTTRRFGGTGLGLSICRELAQLMGGQVGVDSEEGRGSAFWAELPLAPAVPLAERPAQPPAEPRPLAGLPVLVAEDHPVNMMIAVEMLRRWGATVDEATDGGAAIDCVHRAHTEGRYYAAVLMDMHMPVLSGIEATLRLRDRFDAGQLPIIALTAAALASEQRQALDAGMNDFVSKPIDADQLLAVLQRVTRPGGLAAAVAD
ncbi:MAG: PAS domain S-box protein [Burkholderiales bacterium]|nr:PAS domain S-box protein [Burkholderiales bacterium]